MKFQPGPVPILSLIVLIGWSIWFFATVETRRITSVITRIEAAVEAEDTAGCIGWLASDYSDAYGYGPSDVRDVLNDVFRAMDDITVTILNVDIAHGDNSEIVAVDFRVVGTLENGMRGYVMGNPQHPARIVVRMRRAGTWQIHHVERIQAGY
ncbi:MAG TPA: hypothetical protein PLV45_04620 [bacterium]|nr:hypothetical protein [bacterium]